MLKKIKNIVKNIKNIIVLIPLLLIISCSNVEVKEDVTYNLLRGMNYSQSGNYFAAEKEFQKVLSVEPKNIYALSEYAFVQSKLGKNVEAAKLYSRVLEIDPRNVSALKNYAVLLYNDGKFYEALEYVDMIPNILNSKDITKLKSYLGLALKNETLTRIFLEQYLMNEKVYSPILFPIYSEVMIKLGKKEELLNFLNNSYKIMKSNRDFILFYSEILFREFNMSEKAVDTISTYLANNKVDSKSLLKVSEILFKSGKIELAKEIFKELPPSVFGDIEYQNLKTFLHN